MHGRLFLIDCGEGTQTALRRHRVSPLKIDVIALTHYHGDHTFGLPGLLQSMSVAGRTAPLLITGPEGLGEMLGPIMSLAGHLPYDIYLSELTGNGLRLDKLFPAWADGARLTAYPTAHGVPSQCYRFDLPRAGKFLPDRALALGVPTNFWNPLQRGETVTLPDGRTITPDAVLGAPRQGLAFAYSGDTSPCDTLAEAARGADLFVCEATYGDNADEGLALERGHSTFALSARLAAEAGAKRLWLTHFSQSLETPSDYLPNALDFFPGAVCGEDGRHEIIRFDA